MESERGHRCSPEEREGPSGKCKCPLPWQLLSVLQVPNLQARLNNSSTLATLNQSLVAHTAEVTVTAVERKAVALELPWKFPRLQK